MEKKYLKDYDIKDSLGSEINENATNLEALEVLAYGKDEKGHKQSIYEYLGVGDSAIREQLFDILSAETGLDYDVFYEAGIDKEDAQKTLKSFIREDEYVVKANELTAWMKETGKTPEDVYKILKLAGIEKQVGNEHILDGMRNNVEDYVADKAGGEFAEEHREEIDKATKLACKRCWAEEDLGSKEDDLMIEAVHDIDGFSEEIEEAEKELYGTPEERC